MIFKGYKKSEGLPVRVIGQQVDKTPIAEDVRKSEDKPAIKFKGSSTDNAK